MTEFDKHAEQLQELESLRARLEEAEETLRAIKAGEVDALVMDTGAGEQVFTLRTAETAYRVAIESINEGVLTLSSDGLIIYSNCAMGYLLNKPLEQLTGASVFDFTDAVNGESLRALLQNGSGRQELTFKSSAGTTVATLVSITALPVAASPTLTLVAVVTDLTELKRRDEVIAQGKLLRESEARLAEAQRIGHIGSWEWNIQTGSLYWSAGLFAIYGLHPETFSPTMDSFAKFVHPDDRVLVNQMTSRIMASEKDVDFDFRIIAADGSTRFLNAKGTIKEFDESGKPLLMAGVNQDITDRKLVEDNLRVQAKMLNTVAEAVIATNRDGKITYWNDAATVIYGWDISEVMGRNIVDVAVPSFSHEQANEIMAKLVKGESWFGEFQVRRKDGTIFTVEGSDSAVRDDQGNIVAVIGVTRDITERKRQEEILRQALSEAEEGRATLATLMENIPIGITIARMPDLKIQMVSKRGQELLGGSHAGVIVGEVATRWKVFQEDGKTPLAEKDLPLVQAASGQDVINMEVVQVNEWGKSLNLLCSASPIRQGDRITGAVVAWRDVTERRHIEDKLKASEQKYRNLFSSMTEGFALCEIITDSNGQPIDYRTIEANHAWEKLTGLNAASLIGKPLKEQIPGLEQYWIDAYGKVALTGEPAHIENYNSFTDNWYEIYAYSPRERYFVSLVQNITERKKAEVALRESEERFRLSLKNSQVNVSSQDLDLRYTWQYNPQLGYDVKDVLGRTDDELLPPATAEHVKRLKNKTIATGKRTREEVSVIDGKQTLYYDFAVEPLTDIQGNIRGVMNIVIDITERKTTELALAEAKQNLEEQVENRTHDLWSQVEITKRAETELRSLSAKMIVAQEEERRTIAKELHDEVGQTLTVLKLMAGSLNRAIPEELKPRLEAINKELTDVMMRVRLMSQTLRPTVLDDLGLVPGLEWLFARLKEQAGLQIEFDCPKLENLDQKVSITVYRIIQESLTNVMRHSGVKSAFVHISFDENHLMVRVTDYGRGFKHDEVHTSTGLSAMRERAKLLDGKVEVKSEPGKGTVVTLKVPWKPPETKV